MQASERRHRKRADTANGTATEEFFKYAHRDHLGSIEVVTDENGNVLDNLAFEPFGSRKMKDWTGNISSIELNALLALDWDHPRRARGFTGHEHLDRTGFIHMNGRVYDPVLGRFLSPDPMVQFPTFSQSWNRYSYVSNTPTSLIDPSGFRGEGVPEGIEVIDIVGSRSGPWYVMAGVERASLSYGGGGGGYGGGGRGGNACLWSNVTCYLTTTGAETILHALISDVGASASGNGAQDIGTGQAIRDFGGITSNLSKPQRGDSHPVGPPLANNEVETEFSGGDVWIFILTEAIEASRVPIVGTYLLVATGGFIVGYGFGTMFYHIYTELRY